MAKSKGKGASRREAQTHQDVSPAIRLSNLDDVGSAKRPNRILSDEDEATVAEWIVRWLDHGFPLENQKQVSAFARYFMHIVNHPNKDVGVANDFYENLFRRNRAIKDRVHAARKAYKSAKLKNEGREAKEERLARFPAFLNKLQWGLKIPSEHLYVFGDTGFVTAISSEHQGLCIEASTRDDGDYRKMTSAIICGSDNYRFLSPYLISKTSAVNQQRMVYRNVSTSFAAKPWANAEFFLDWIECVFEKETKPVRSKGPGAPGRLLLVDGIRYGITPEIFMSCWNKGIYLVCIPHKGSPFFNPLECGVFSKMHKVYAEEAATKYREAKAPFILGPRHVTDFILHLLDRNLLKGQLERAWKKSHLHSRDEEALRKHVKGIPATPAPVTPIKARTRSAARQQVIQTQPISPPRSSQQPEESRHARESTSDSSSTSENEYETPKRQRPSGPRNRPPPANSLPRDAGVAKENPSLESPLRAHCIPRPSQMIQISDDESSVHTASNSIPSNGENSDEEASIREEATPIFRASSPSRQRPISASSFYGMSGALLEPRNQSPNRTRVIAPSVEIINSHTPVRTDHDGPRPRDNERAESDEMLDTTENIWTGAGLESAYRMQIRALSDPQTPEKQRKTYENKLLALAPIFSGFAPGTVSALQALAKASSKKDPAQPSSSRPLTPQTSQRARVRKEKPNKQRRQPRTDRGPHQRTNHTYF
ncbi:uncharacterized protein N7496_008905 [Penicillium cataractarum]|uniref:DDE-1 domain-containing protein n=1 Tax=Penicillium cataractarum TaxID=2100454 RepID=A0A9W9V7D0_9EURO|nr:uncharacterized protein N7496_008905 [Penicillium cataractarum]KAJ5369145.1 hypothetical protein N7496_008905 [Penicillium cataractarum]